MTMPILLTILLTLIATAAIGIVALATVGEYGAAATICFAAAALGLAVLIADRIKP
jgi:hypothetical protein